MADNEQHYCMALSAGLDTETLPAATHTRGFVLNANRWHPGEEIRIRFLGGDPGLQARVEAVAREWLKFANLRFRFVPAGSKADIRIAFGPGKGSWSYIGTVCRQFKDQNVPTMNFGWLTPQSSDDDVRRVVLHEFGHALGMIHEHQNPIQGVKWNKPAVIKDLSGPPNNWSAKTIETNMFAKYDPKKGVGTKFDKDSIMLYPIPKSWTLDGFTVGLNRDLSASDKLLLAQVYPK